MIEKTAKFFKDARSIWLGMFMLVSAAVWGGNLQWVQKDAYNEDQKITVIQQINREIADIEIKLLYIQDPQQKAMNQAIIINKKTQIKNIKEK